MIVHVVPDRDEREHELAVDCWCDPSVEWDNPDTGLPWPEGGVRVIHNAADCRELAEGDGKSMEPGKKWKTVRVA